MDVRLEFNSKINHFSENTSAYCLILHDRIVEYNAVSGDVRIPMHLQVDVSKVVYFCFYHDIQCKINCAAQNVNIKKQFLTAQPEWQDILIEWNA